MKKMIKILSLFAVLCVVTGCSSNRNNDMVIELNENAVRVFYISNETLTLEDEAYTPTEKTAESLIEELYDVLAQQPKRYNHKCAVPAEVKLQSYLLDGEQLTLYFGDSYYSMDSITEVLCRAAVVKTLLQIEGIDGIEFMVNNQPLVDKSGHTIGLMTKDTFIEGKGEELNSYQETELKLYFSNAGGNELVIVKRRLLYNNHIPIEKLIVEQLLKGMDGEENSSVAKSSLPPDTKLLNLYVKDGVCYVNFDENFVSQAINVDEEIMIYSLVNSLTEIPAITKVQISINGVSNRVFKEKVNLNTMFERNLEYLQE